MISSIHDPIGALLGAWAENITVWSVLLRVVCAAALSAVIGTERSSKRHSAGLRTFMLVTLAGTMAMLTDIWLHQLLNSGMYLLSTAAVISTTMIATNSLFISSRNQIKGITTAAGLLVCCLLGISLGAGFYTLTLVAAVVILFCLSFLPVVENDLKDRSNHFELHLELASGQHLKEFVATIRELGLKIDDIETNEAYVNSGLNVYSVAVSITKDELKKFKTHKEIIAALGTLDYVSHIEEI